MMNERFRVVNQANYQTVGLEALVRNVLLHGGLVEKLMEGTSSPPPEWAIFAEGKRPSEPGAEIDMMVRQRMDRDGAGRRYYIHIHHGRAGPIRIVRRPLLEEL